MGNIDRYPNTASKNRAFEIFEKLDHLDVAEVGAFLPDESQTIPYLHFDEEAQQLFDSWHKDLELELRSGRIDHPALEAHLSKYRSLMPSLALLFHLIDKVDGGINQKLWKGQSLRKLGQRKNCGVVPDHERAQELPHRVLRSRDVNVTPPDPRGSMGTCVNQRGRLRIVDHRKLPIEVHPLRIVAIALDKRVIHLWRDSLSGPLEGVVKAFGRAVKEIGSRHHFPPNLDSQFFK